MIRKKKLYVRPKKAYEKVRIAEENIIVQKYGLKNKREIWKTAARVNYFRRRAKDLAKESHEEQEVLFNKLQELGLHIKTIADVLDLKVEDLLERRLPTLVVKKGFAFTPQHARQLVVHKKITVNNNVVNTPSYLVRVSEEPTISSKAGKPVKPVHKQKEAEQEAAEEIVEESA
ncbi:30S ribosomal protein S4 [Candidatus Pacearchaeota archaeon]|nr:30S ribosomal protein S4 [Candidatus Pacearchaeota archaeon]